MSDSGRARSAPLRRPEELVNIGFGRSRVVMMNEAHDGSRRCVRTRAVGRRVLRTAYEKGVRHLAMEALWPAVAAQANRTRRVPESDQLGYLRQPEMRQLVQDALDLGYVLIAYEASHDEALSLGGTLPGMAATNRREAIQVRNLTRALAALPTHAKLLVWCGNGHLGKTPVGDWMPMGYQVQVQSGIMPFAIDQTRSVLFPRLPDAARASAERLVDAYTPQLLRLGGTAGWLTEEAPHHLRRTFEDAFLLSVHNALE